MEELKRCPFCGGEATVMEAVGEVWVKCSECHSSNGVSTGDRAKAIAEWNQRQEADRLANRANDLRRSLLKAADWLDEPCEQAKFASWCRDMAGPAEKTPND